MTETTRRTLLRAGAVGLVVAPACTAGAVSAASAARPLPSKYGRSRFTPFLGSSFRMADESGSWPVTLAAIGDLPNAARGADECFYLTLGCPSGGPSQGTYILRRQGFSGTSLFVVPSDASCRTYQAVVNRS
jgi:hypothetical protein